VNMNALWRELEEEREEQEIFQTFSETTSNLSTPQSTSSAAVVPTIETITVSPVVMEGEKDKIIPDANLQCDENQVLADVEESSVLGTPTSPKSIQPSLSALHFIRTLFLSSIMSLVSGVIPQPNTSHEKDEMDSSCNSETTGCDSSNFQDTVILQSTDIVADLLKRNGSDTPAVSNTSNSSHTSNGLVASVNNLLHVFYVLLGYHDGTSSHMEKHGLGDFEQFLKFLTSGSGS